MDCCGDRLNNSRLPSTDSCLALCRKSGGPEHRRMQWQGRHIRHGAVARAEKDAKSSRSTGVWNAAKHSEAIRQLLRSLPRLGLAGHEVSQSNGAATAKAAIDGNTDGAFGKGSGTTTTRTQTAVESHAGEGV